MEKMKELYEKVTIDNTLKKKLAEILNSVKEADKTETDEKLIGFAKAAGYDVSIDEMQEFFKHLAEKKDGSLLEAELDVVAGGKSNDQDLPASIIAVIKYGGICFG